VGAPDLAVAVSGGADSTALALLAQRFARERGGRVRAFIVDHGLRDGSGPEAALTRGRLAAQGIESEILTLQGLPSGAGLQTHARRARYEALSQAAFAAGCLYVLLGHHADDQAETVAMRAERGAGGLEGMAAWSARGPMVLLRPLLGFRKHELRGWLAAQGMAWVEDPSNLSERFERVRVRLAGTEAVAVGAEARAAREARDAAFMAAHVVIRPEGFALVDAGEVPVSVLGAVIRTVGGADYAPRQEALGRFAGRLYRATLGGVRILPAGRLGAGWLCVRELAASAPPVAAKTGARWDGRFSLAAGSAGGSLGALGCEVKKFKNYNSLPNSVLAVMPALRGPGGEVAFPAPACFVPPQPLCSREFWA